MSFNGKKIRRLYTFTALKFLLPEIQLLAFGKQCDDADECTK